jgi:hypothetical protein
MAKKPKPDTRGLIQGTLNLALKGGLDPDELRSAVEEAIAGTEPAPKPQGKFNAGMADRLLRGELFTARSDSPYLYLEHPRPDVGYWFFRHKGKRTDIGPAHGEHKVTPDEARAIRDRALRALREGRDPGEEIKRAKEERRSPEPQQSPPQTDKPTNSYNAVWETYRERFIIGTHPSNVKKRDGWHKDHIAPVIGNRDVQKITDKEIDEKIVKPIFEEVEPEPSPTVGLVDAARLIGKSMTAIHETINRKNSERLPFTLDERTGKRRFKLEDLERIFSVTINDDGKRAVPGPHKREGHGARKGIRVLYQIAAVLDFATACHLRTGDNPARWHGLFEHRYKADDTPEGHYAALPWQRVSELARNLRAVPERHWHHIPKVLAQLAEAHVLAAAGRCRSLREARWSWVDWGTLTLNVPTSFIKTRKKIRNKRVRIVLGPRMQEIFRERLADRRTTDNDLVFPCRDVAPSGNCRQKRRPLKEARPFGPVVVLKLIQACSPPGAIPKFDSVELEPLLTGDEPVRVSVETEESLDATAHGLRSSFRDWGGENEYTDEMLERCLTHEIGDKNVRAYARSDYLNLRRKIMTAWETECCSLPDSSFVPPEPKVYVRADQPVIDEGWRLFISGEAETLRQAAQLAVNRISGATSVASVYQYMWSHPPPDAPPVKEHNPYGSSRPFVEQARNLLLTEAAKSFYEASHIAAASSGGAVTAAAIERRLRSQPDLARFNGKGKPGRKPSTHPLTNAERQKRWREKRLADAAD